MAISAKIATCSTQQTLPFEMNIHSRRIKHLLDQRLLQLGVLRFKRLQPLRIGNRQTVEFCLSGMRRTFRHVVPAAQMGTLRACFMIVQHAVHDRPFQEEVLSRLKKLYPLGLTAPRNYAFLYDRLRFLVGKPERYGTQGSCRDGEAVDGQLEDPENVDRLRASMGMEPLPDCPAR